METIKCYTSWRKYFTPIWWKLQALSLLTGRPPLNIVATFTIEAPDISDSSAVINERGLGNQAEVEANKGKT